MKKHNFKQRMLVVDDDAVMRAVLRKTMEKNGFAVTEAAGGEAALELFYELRPDIVLLDAMMPGMDGFQTCAALRGRFGGEHVPVLMLTSLSDEDSVNRAYEIDATDFFVKGSPMTMLTQRVRYLLRSARMRAELAKSRGILAKAQQIARVGSWEWNARQGVVAASGECLRILGLGLGDATVDEELFCRHASGLSCDEFEQLVQHDLAVSGAFRREFEVQRVAAPALTLQIEAEAEIGVDVAPGTVLGTIQDITERKHSERELNRLANFDSLTGLANRNLFRDRFELAIDQARRSNGMLALLFIDLDRFKVVNDTLGHGVGDALLCVVAERLNGCVRGGDSISHAGEDQSLGSVARLGGDEFIALLTGLKTVENATCVAERMLAALNRPIDVNGHEIWISASIGVASYPSDGDNAETLLMRADSAMYETKSRGRNGHTVYTPALDACNLEIFQLETDLRKALDRDELRLHYQPIVDGRTGRMVGCEVLMRWQRKDCMVQPNDFIPIAEETGLIFAMGEWAIETASRQVARWHAQGLDPIYVSVNLPGSHFRQPGLAQMVQKHLSAAGLPARFLNIEITETVVMKAVERTMQSLHALRDMGVSISIDDFGTGYSSLAYLKRLPITTLKIDRSFIKDIAVDSDDEVIVSAIIGLARSLKMNVVAEGVETAAQRAFLNMFGATLMQGYLFSRPCAANEFEHLLRANNDPAQQARWISPDDNRVIHLFETRARSDSAQLVSG